MIDDDTFDKYFMEIQMVLRRYQRTAAGLEGEKLLALRREENEVLLDLLMQQKRALAFAAGEKVEPMVQFGKGVLVGKVG